VKSKARIESEAGIESEGKGEARGEGKAVERGSEADAPLGLLGGEAAGRGGRQKDAQLHIHILILVKIWKRYFYTRFFNI